MPPKLSTVQSWGFDWLEIVSEKGIVNRLKCKYCIKFQDSLKYSRNFSRNFIDGISGTALKRDGATKHASSDMHKKAVQLLSKPKSTEELFQKTPLGRSLSKVKDAEKERVGKLIDIAYMMAKEEIPFKKFPAMIEVELRHEVKLGHSYHNAIMAREFTDAVGTVMERKFKEELVTAPYISLLVDGSTDTSVTEKELMYVKFVNMKTGEPETKFFRLKDVGHANATGLHESVKDAFGEFGIDRFEEKLVGFMADGANVNLGQRGGLSALLKRDSPWLVAIHCLNHKFELAVKDAFKNVFSEVNDILVALYYLYEKSPKRLRELRELGEIMEEHVSKPLKANGTRWVEHKRNACKALVSSYGVIVTHLESLANSSTGADQAKFRGYLRQMKSFKFLLHLLLLREWLVPLSEVSLNMEKEAVDILVAMNMLQNLTQSLQKFADGSHLYADDSYSMLSQFVSQAEKDPGNADFQDIPLMHASAVSLEKFKKDVPKYAEQLLQCLQKRFANLDQDDIILKCLLLVDTKMWPESKSDEMESFGVKELHVFVKHFEDILLKNEVDISLLENEWELFRSFKARNLGHLAQSEVIKYLLGTQRKVYPNLWHVFCILQTFPVSNAIVERGFSTMGRVKNDDRNRLGEKCLELLMRISLEGPPLAKFDNGPAVKVFFEKERHPGPDSSGKRSLSEWSASGGSSSQGEQVPQDKRPREAN